MPKQAEMKEVISKDLIFLNEEKNNQDDVIREIISNAADVGYVMDTEELFESVKSREAQIPTAIGYQIAMPHGKTAAVKHPFIAFLRTNNDFQWSNQSDELVKLIFLIGVPKEHEGKLHLKFISQLSKKLLDEDFRGRLLCTNDVEEIYSQLSSIEL